MTVKWHPTSEKQMVDRVHPVCHGSPIQLPCINTHLCPYLNEWQDGDDTYPWLADNEKGDGFRCEKKHTDIAVKKTP